MQYTRKMAMLGVAIACLTPGYPALAGPGGANGKPFIALDDQIVEVQGEISSLQDQVDLLIGRVDSVEAKVEAGGLAIQNLQATTASLQVLVSQNLSDVAAIESQISQLEIEITSLTAQIASTSGDVAQLEQQLTEMQTLQGQLQAALLAVNTGMIELEVGLQSQIDNNAELIAAIQSEIFSINQILTFQQNLAAGTCPGGSAVQDVLADGTYVCGSTGSGGAGTLQSIRLMKTMNLDPNGSNYSYLDCPDGWIATSAGFLVQWEVRVLGSYTSGNSSFLSARNLGTYGVPVYNLATCARLAP